MGHSKIHRIEPAGAMAPSWTSAIAGDVLLRVLKPTSGGWFTFDLEITHYEGFKRLLADLEADDRWYQRIWHRTARPWRRLKRKVRV